MGVVVLLFEPLKQVLLSVEEGGHEVPACSLQDLSFHDCNVAGNSKCSWFTTYASSENFESAYSSVSHIGPIPRLNWKIPLVMAQEAELKPAMRHTTRGSSMVHWFVHTVGVFIHYQFSPYVVLLLKN